MQPPASILWQWERNSETCWRLRVKSAIGPVVHSTSRSAQCRVSGNSTIRIRTPRFRNTAKLVRRRSLIRIAATLSWTNGREQSFLRRAGMNVNLGGIGKGYTVDRARDILRRRGLNDFMIQFGGDLYGVGGHEGDRPWRLGIQEPRGPANKIFAELDLSDSTFSTSGDYRTILYKKWPQGIITSSIPLTGEPAPLLPQRDSLITGQCDDCRRVVKGRVHSRAEGRHGVN